MVLDCGGGTIDITSHLVESSDPLQLSELAEPCGGAWGSSIVDARFKSFLQVRYHHMTWHAIPCHTLHCTGSLDYSIIVLVAYRIIPYHPIPTVVSVACRLNLVTTKRPISRVRAPPRDVFFFALQKRAAESAS